MRLGALETTAVTHLPEHAASFLRRFPEVDLSVNTGDTHSLVRQVLDHKVDGAFVYGPVEYMDIKQIPVSYEELVLISPEEGAIEDMLRLPMLFFGTGCSHRDRVKRLLEEAGIQQQKIIEFGTLKPLSEVFPLVWERRCCQSRPLPALSIAKGYTFTSFPHHIRI